MYCVYNNDVKKKQLIHNMYVYVYSATTFIWYMWEGENFFLKGSPMVQTDLVLLVLTASISLRWMEEILHQAG